LVVVQDIHGGSDVALCTPDGMPKDTGQMVMPSPGQKWLWDGWVSCWDEVARIQDRERPETTVLGINGDCTDGNHHGTHEIISPLESMHVRVAHNCLEYALKRVPPDGIHMIRGTGVHVGRAGALEEGLARVLRDKGYPMVEDPDLPNVTSYHRRFELGGLLVDMKHHGRMGQRAHTRGPYMRWYAQDIEMEHRLDEVRPPDLALRAHNHTYGDSGREHRWKTRVIAGPCWQLSTEYSHRRAYESLPTIGMYCVVIRDGEDQVIKLLHKPDRPTVTEATV
jgi:hypothetical protein